MPKRRTTLFGAKRKNNLGRIHGYTDTSKGWRFGKASKKSYRTTAKRKKMR